MARQAKKLTFLLAISLLVSGPSLAGEEPIQAPITPRGFGFTAPVSVNSAEPADLVIDSGSSFTIISPALAKRAGIIIGPKNPRYPLSAAGGMAWVRLVVIDSVKVGGVSVINVEGAVADLPSFKGAMGLLGKSYLDRFAFRLDGRARVMELSPPNNGPLFGGRGEGWWRQTARRLQQQAELFRALERGVDNSLRMGDAPARQLMEKLTRADAVLLGEYYERLLESLRREAGELKAPEEWTR